MEHWLPRVEDLRKLSYSPRPEPQPVASSREELPANWDSPHYLPQVERLRRLPDSLGPPPNSEDPDYEAKMTDYERRVAEREAAIEGLNRDEEALQRSQLQKPDPWE